MHVQIIACILYRKEYNAMTCIYGKSTEMAGSMQSRTRLLEPYGPWMFATKRGNRVSNWSQSKARGGISAEASKRDGGKNGKSITTDFSGKSRFDVLNEASLEDDEVDNEPTSEELWANKVNGEGNNGPKGTTKAKGKRPNVQINEKQIMGKKGPAYEEGNAQDENSGVRPVCRTTQKKTVNRAAAAEDHVVVHGERNGAHVTSVRVTNSEEAAVLQCIPVLEHHSDPPLRDEQFDLNFSVSDNGLFEKGSVHGEASGSGGRQPMPS